MQCRDMSGSGMVYKILVSIYKDRYLEEILLPARDQSQDFGSEIAMTC